MSAKLLMMRLKKSTRRESKMEKALLKWTNWKLQGIVHW